jgi:hypothetical protein
MGDARDNTRLPEQPYEEVSQYTLTRPQYGTDNAEGSPR